MRTPRPLRFLPLLLMAAAPATAQTLPPAREAQLVRLVRQDCGACHGMRLGGGLGPALTREALAGRPVDSLAATIVQGRPGTPMPAWRGLLSDGEAGWIAVRLVEGFPEEPKAARR